MSYRVLLGNALDVLAEQPSQTAQTCITSPPYYGLRDYGVEGQIGLEKTPDEYIAKLVAVFHEVRRVLKDDGTLWVNIGDSFAGSGKGAWANKDGGQKEVYIPDPDSPQVKLPKVPLGLKSKDLMGIPWLLAFALRADGWFLRQDIIWHKPNPMPESVTDRCTKSHEYIFLLSKQERYYYNHEAIKEEAKSGERFHGGYSAATNGSQRNGRENQENFIDQRNKRSVWTVPVGGYPEAHFATYPVDLITPCVLAGSRPNDTVLDPFNGSGTTGEAALKFGREYLGVELNPEYIALTHKRLKPWNERQLILT